MMKALVVVNVVVAVAAAIMAFGPSRAMAQSSNTSDDPFFYTSCGDAFMPRSIDTCCTQTTPVLGYCDFKQTCHDSGTGCCRTGSKPCGTGCVDFLVTCCTGGAVACSGLDLCAGDGKGCVSFLDQAKAAPVVRISATLPLTALVTKPAAPTPSNNAHAPSNNKGAGGNAISPQNSDAPGDPQNPQGVQKSPTVFSTTSIRPSPSSFIATTASSTTTETENSPTVFSTTSLRPSSSSFIATTAPSTTTETAPPVSSSSAPGLPVWAYVAIGSGIAILLVIIAATTLVICIKRNNHADNVAVVESQQQLQEKEKEEEEPGGGGVVEPGGGGVVEPGGSGVVEPGGGGVAEPGIGVEPGGGAEADEQ